jgi:hypothetical protein
VILIMKDSGVTSPPNLHPTFSLLTLLLYNLLFHLAVLFTGVQMMDFTVHLFWVNFHLPVILHPSSSVSQGAETHGGGGCSLALS